MPVSAVFPHDLVFAARLLRKNPGFTLVAAVSLALAIGANTTIFSVAKQLLFERLDIPDAANLRLLTSTDANFSYPMYERLRAQNQVLGDLLAFHATAVNATVGENAVRVLAHEVSANYYAVLRVRPQLGRAIHPVDDTAGSEPVVVISDEFWEREFARSPGGARTVDQVERCSDHDRRRESKRLYRSREHAAVASAGGDRRAVEGDTGNAVLRRPELAGGPGIAIRQHPGAHPRDGNMNRSTLRR